MKRELNSLNQVLNKWIVKVSIEHTTNHNFFETIRLDFDDNTFIQILTPTKSELTERTKMHVYDSALKKNSVQFNPLDHEQTK